MSRGVTPVPVHSHLGDRRAFETTNVIVEDREFIFAEYVIVRVLVDAAPDIDDRLLEVCFYCRVELAFGAASNVEPIPSTLVSPLRLIFRL